MKTFRRPIRTTLIFGLICGLSFIPLQLSLSFLISWSTAFALILWLYSAVYGIILCRWGGKGIGSIIFPLLLQLTAVFFTGSLTAYIIVALLILSWMRSGICYDKSLQGLWAELVLSFGGGALVSLFVNGSVVTWALGIWMYFLVQAIYFVFFETSMTEGTREQNIDPFEKSRQMAEDLLA